MKWCYGSSKLDWVSETGPEKAQVFKRERMKELGGDYQIKYFLLTQRFIKIGFSDMKKRVTQ